MASEMSTMEKIRKGLKQRHPRPKDEFVEAVYSLYKEFRDAYSKQEWPRLDACERMYQGDHWHDVQEREQNEPRPTTPVIFSTIENIRADLTDEFPEAVIRPEDSSNQLIAKVLTEVVAQNLEACDFDKEYDAMTHDLLVGGWTAQETGWDSVANGGFGGAYLRHVSNKSILFDPNCKDIQDGRAVFKFDILPKDWFAQRYPDIYSKMEDDDAVSEGHDSYNDPVQPDEKENFTLIEAWFRVFNPERSRYDVHMVKLAGGCVLENSYEIKPSGYYAHGQYPFVVTPLFERKGSPLGLGIVDMFKNVQQYSDKIDQIILKNALTAGHNRIFYQNGMVDPEDLKDYSKELLAVEGNPNAVMAWQQDRPLPSHILAYMQQKLQTIKEESGSNDFSRGNVSAGVTAASAITALQEMSSKRSRMEARRVHYGFKQAVRQMIEVEREFDVFPRQVVITVDGEPVPIVVSNEMYKQLSGDVKLPIEFKVKIKPVRETKFTRLSNNQMMLEFAAMFQGQLEPTVIMEPMEFEGKEVVLEKLRAAQGRGMAALQQQLAQAMEQLNMTQEENASLKQALVAAKNAITAEPQIPDTLAVDTMQQNAGNPGVF